MSQSIADQVSNSENFARYTSVSVNALKFIENNLAAVEKKSEVLDSVIQAHNLNYDSVLFVGFNPWILKSKFKHTYVTCLTDLSREYLDASGLAYTYIPYEKLLDSDQAFECVVAADEFTTFAKDETSQREHVNIICEFADRLLVTSLRDYKNQDFREREFSQPTAIKVDQLPKIFLEHHNYDLQDRYAWNCQVYELTGGDMVYHGSFNRRAMFFKQLAKFTSDVGATQFLVHKNIMYKSMLRWNYEHIIGIEF